MVLALQDSSYLINENQVGFSMYEKGREHYVVQGGGLQFVELEPDDIISIKDPEGMQYGEILLWDQQGRPDVSAIGEKTYIPAVATKNLFKANQNDYGFKKVLQGLKQRNIDINKAIAVSIFGDKSPMNAVVNFTVKSKCYCIVAAPLGGSPIYGEVALTDLELVIHRKRFDKNSQTVEVMPDPLGDTINEFRIDAGTVKDFEVKQGQFIQIIDLSGRQCSDLQVFDTKKLQNGVESMISGVATRSNIGHLYPHPGLRSKYFNDDHEVMCQVIQDTVGRHDTLGIACSARTYEERGFMGHRNCSDNISKQGEKYGIRPRRAWEAINFFFNSNPNHDSRASITSDETFSRPGDYTIVKASRDLVSFVSSCPDDLDATNGWNPTDIYVRVYDEKADCKMAIGYRATAEGKLIMTKQTEFHARTSKLTANYTEAMGYWVPAQYNNSSAREEYLNVRNNVGIIDLSQIAKVDIIGPDAEALCQMVFTRNIPKLTPNSIVYTAACYDNGTMIDDGTLFRINDDLFRYTGGSLVMHTWLREKATEFNLKVIVKDATKTISNIAVQGPNSRKLLKKIIWTAQRNTPLEDLGCFKFSTARLAPETGTPIVVSRTGYTGELGYELWCAPQDALELWDRVMQAGEEFGIKPFGAEALGMLRLEAGLIYGGLEFDDTTDPQEAGVKFTTPLKSQPHDFIGRQALERRFANPMRTLVGLEITGNEPASHGDGLFVGRGTVGQITSAMRSPILNKNIALARIDIQYQEIGTELEIGKLDGQQKRLKAKVVKTPFYDPERTKMRQHKDDD